jgi:chromosome segregation ATPase
MGQGQAKLTDALDVSKRELANANARCQALEAQIAMLKSEVTQAAQTLQQSKAALQKEGQAHEQLVDSYDAELSKAVKQRQLAEELRRSDALLAKRIMCAQRLAQEVSAPEAGSVMADGPITAQFALAAQDEMMLRKVVPAHITQELLLTATEMI